jgi:tetratricopeptide (TPR) repeat protein
VLASTRVDHLSDELVARAAHGTLSEDESERTGRHAASCLTCRRRIERAREATTRPEGTFAPTIGSSPGDPLAGLSRVGRYFILNRLGSGGMGAVYSAYDPELDRRVAIKVLDLRPSDWADASEGRVKLFREAQARLLREAQAMAQLAHPNVIAVHDMGTVGEGVFFAMERVEGGTLRDWLHSPRGWREVLALFLQAGRGLVAAHAAGIIHRDFKPENVLVGIDGRVRVTDFGVARALSAPPEGQLPTGPRSLSAELTSSGQVVGTPGYLAPEQLDGAATDRSDQFSFAVTMFEALTGKRPFTLEQAYARDLTDAVPAFPPGSKVPGHLREAILRGLEKDAGRRFASMEAFLAALERDPRARRLRLFAAAVALGVVAAVGGRSLVIQARHQRACDELATSATRAWQRARPRVAAAFPRSGRPHAADALRLVGAALDDFARAWGTARGAVCREKVELPPSSRALAAACLDQAAQSMNAATELLAGGDPAVVQRATEMVGAIPAVADCLDAEALRTAPEPPSDSVAALVASTRVRLIHAQLLAVPHPDEGIAAMRPLLVALEPAHYPAALAEIHFLIGESESRADRVLEAEVALQQAAELALAGHHDRLFIRAASRLAFVLGGYDKQTDRARDWLRLAQQAYDRVGRPAALEGWLALQETGLQLGGGHYRQCAETAARAVAGLRRAADRFHETEAAFLLAECESYSQGIDQVLTSFDAALKLHMSTFGPDHPDTGTAMDGLAYARWLAGDFAGALALAEQSLRIDESQAAPTLQLVFGHEYLARVLEELGRDEDALAHRLKARDFLKGVPHRPISDAEIFSGLAQSERKTGRLREAFADAASAVAACTPAVDAAWPHRCAPAHFAYAQVLADRGQRDLAVQHATRARDGYSLHPAERRLRERVLAWAEAHSLVLDPVNGG